MLYELFKRDVDGFTITAGIEYDDDATPPWERHDGHGPVSDWTTRGKRPGERVLARDGNSYRYYDYAEAVAIARRDGWNAPPYDEGTPGERAVRAVDADMKRLKDWCEDRWHYCGVVLAVSKAGITLSECAASLWGIEDDAGEYLTEAAEELIPEAVDVGRAKLAKLMAEA